MRIMVDVMFIFAEGRPVPNVRRGRYLFGLSVPDGRRVEYQLLEENIIFCYQSEKLLYTAMK